jgi:hypothetical protein
MSCCFNHSGTKSAERLLRSILLLIDCKFIRDILDKTTLFLNKIVDISCISHNHGEYQNIIYLRIFSGNCQKNHFFNKIQLDYNRDASRKFQSK